MLLASSLSEAVGLLSAEPYASTIETIYVIGGAAAFAEALRGEGGVVASTVHLTRVMSDVACDVFIPQLEDGTFALADFKPRQKENDVEFQFCTYKRRDLHGLARTSRPFGGPGPARHEEHQYLDAIRDIISTGVSRSDRTGTGTLSKFGMSMRWSLRGNALPLLTTKRVFWRGVAEELLWFISGATGRMRGPSHTTSRKPPLFTRAHPPSSLQRSPFRRRHERAEPAVQGDPHLGRQRLPGVPGPQRAGPPGGGRPGARVRLPVAPLWCRVQGHARRLHVSAAMCETPRRPPSRLAPSVAPI